MKERDCIMLLSSFIFQFWQTFRNLWDVDKYNMLGSWLKMQCIVCSTMGSYKADEWLNNGKVEEIPRIFPVQLGDDNHSAFITPLEPSQNAHAGSHKLSMSVKSNNVCVVYIKFPSYLESAWIFKKQNCPFFPFSFWPLCQTCASNVKGRFGKTH